MIVLKFYFAGILCFKTSCNDVNDLDKIVSKFFDDNRVFTHLETTYDFD